MPGETVAPAQRVDYPWVQHAERARGGGEARDCVGNGENHRNMALDGARERPEGWHVSMRILHPAQIEELFNEIFSSYQTFSSFRAVPNW